MRSASLMALFFCAVVAGAAAGCGSNGGGGPSDAAAGMGGGGLGGSGGAAGTTGGAGGGGGGTAGAYIVADIDGVTTHFEVNASSFWFQGIADFSIALMAETDTLRWFILAPNDVGEFTCSSGGYYMELNPKPASAQPGWATHSAGGTCAVNIATAAPNVGDLMQGTFTATLTGQGMSRAVTNGAFRLPRRSDGPP